MAGAPSMNSDAGESLPSELFAQFDREKATAKDEETDYEGLVQRTLSALAFQPDLMDIWLNDEQDSIPDWLWRRLIGDWDDKKATSPRDVLYEWHMGTRFLRLVLPELTPFEIHHVASQSIVFSEGSEAHWALCMLLCVYALRQCPPSGDALKQRWKRWQSLVCETVRLFQNFELGRLAIPLWIQHVVPACQHVMARLPTEAYHIAFLSAMVGTTSTLAAKELEQPEREMEQLRDSLLRRILRLLDTLRNIAEQNDLDELWIRMNPWRVQAAVNSDVHVEAQCDEAELLCNQNDIAWWNCSVHRHECVAGMDTLWDEFGISLLAMMSFDGRPQLFTPAHTWNVWFPHVSILFKSTSGNSLLDHLPMQLLKSLVDVVPEASLPEVSSTSIKPNAPFETFQLLSNRLVVKAPRSSTGKKAALEESKDVTTEVVALMTKLLARYEAVNQGKIIRKLVHDCPHPGLKAKFMDLLRPIIFEESASDALWSYMNSFVKKMLSHVEKEHKELVRTDELVQDVEIYVGVVTMLELWRMVKGSLPNKMKGHHIGRFHKTLKRMLEAWTSDEGGIPPDDFYRLYLLEGALDRISENGDQVQNADGTGGSYGSTPATEDSSERSEDRIFGDVDIFD